MRKTLTTLLLAACLPTVTLATPPAEEVPSVSATPCTGTDMPCHGHKLGLKGPKDKGPMRDLNLTPEQHQKMRQIMAEQFKAQHDITKKYLDKLPEADKKAMKAEIEAARANGDKQVHALLNAEQQKKFDAIKAQHDEHRKLPVQLQENKTSETAK